MLVSALVGGWKRDGEWPVASSNATNGGANGAGESARGHAWGTKSVAHDRWDIKVPGSGLSIDAPASNGNGEGNGGMTHCPVERSIDKGRRLLQRRRRGESNPTGRGNSGHATAEREGRVAGPSLSVEGIGLPERIVTREEAG